MSDIKTFVSKFPKEFNEFVEVFKSFKINNNTQEISRDTVINIVENPYLKEFVKTLTEDELVELLKMLGMKLKKKVITKSISNKKTKISILNSIIQKMLLSGLEKEYTKQVFSLFAKIPINELERLDKFDKFENNFINEITISILKIEKKLIDKSADIVNYKTNEEIKNNGNNDTMNQIKSRFSAFSNETGNIADLKHIHNYEKQNILQN